MKSADLWKQLDNFDPEIVEIASRVKPHGVESLKALAQVALLLVQILISEQAEAAQRGHLRK
jgi:hypothetical protein